MTKKTLPLLTVVIATRNEEKNIKRCIRSIEEQTISRDMIEIIVVDNHSIDLTRQIAQPIADKVFLLPASSKPLKTMNFRGAQLNYGVKKSQGQIIFFPDADMTFDKELLKEIVNLITDKTDALYIPEVVVGCGLFGQIRNFERSFYNQTSIDAVRAVKKDLFLKINGFDEENIQFGPDDWDFTKRLKNKRLGITINKIYHHEEDLDFKSYIIKKWKYTNTFSGYISKWGENDPDIKKQFGFYYRYIGVFIEKGRWKKLLMNPLLTLGIYFLRFTVGIAYLYQKIFKQNNAA